MNELKPFWSGVDLTGNQMGHAPGSPLPAFWSGVDLTGNQIRNRCPVFPMTFWSGVDLTGNQIFRLQTLHAFCFGAVSI